MSTWHPWRRGGGESLARVTPEHRLTIAIALEWRHKVTGAATAPPRRRHGVAMAGAISTSSTQSPNRGVVDHPCEDFVFLNKMVIKLIYAAIDGCMR